MKKLLIPFAGCLLFCISLNAQISYSFMPVSGTYAPISGGITANLDSPSVEYTRPDEGYANGISIGFAFTYNGVAYTNVNINVNGFITLGEGFVEDDFENYYFNSLSLARFRR